MKLSYATIQRVIERLQGNGYWDTASEYGEPGYSTTGDTPLVVLGYYWCHCHKFDPDDPRPLHPLERHHPRLWQQMADQGVQFEWYDEWTTHNDKAWRTQADSHSWVPSYVYTDGDIITTDDDITEWVEWALNDPSRALLHHSEQDIEPLGFIQWPDDDTYYETGWHPHQTDDPQQVMAAIQAEHPDDDIIFIINGVGQFDARWTAYRRPQEVNA